MKATVNNSEKKPPPGSDHDQQAPGAKKRKTVSEDVALAPGPGENGDGGKSRDAEGGHKGSREGGMEGDVKGEADESGDKKWEEAGVEGGAPSTGGNNNEEEPALPGTSLPASAVKCKPGILLDGYKGINVWPKRMQEAANKMKFTCLVRRCKL